VRAVLDPNVIISGLISRGGAPARVLARGLKGDFEIVISPQLISELATALTYRKLRTHITPDEAAEVVDLMQRRALSSADSGVAPPVASRDAGDDYLLALAASARAMIVTGDNDLLDLADRLPIYAPADFLELLDR
jgi:putative PIN family toxin of toxin-antitoxin system